MKNVKMILPIVAFIFAVVGAFASINAEVLPPYYIQINGQCTEITQEVTCAETGEFICKIMVSGSPRDIYDNQLNSTTCQDRVQHTSLEPVE